MALCCLPDRSNCLYTTPSKMGIFFPINNDEIHCCYFVFFWEKLLKNKGKKDFEREKCVTSTAEIWWMDEMIILDLTAIFKWGSGEWREGVNSFFFFLFFFFLRGERERSPQLSQIMLPSSPHLGESQASTPPKCNGGVSTWRNCLADHSILWAR